MFTRNPSQGLSLLILLLQFKTPSPAVISAEGQCLEPYYCDNLKHVHRLLSQPRCSASNRLIYTSKLSKTSPTIAYTHDTDSDLYILVIRPTLFESVYSHAQHRNAYIMLKISLFGSIYPRTQNRNSSTMIGSWSLLSFCNCTWGILSQTSPDINLTPFNLPVQRGSCFQVLMLNGVDLQNTTHNTNPEFSSTHRERFLIPLLTSCNQQFFNIKQTILPVVHLPTSVTSSPTSESLLSASPAQPPFLYPSPRLILHPPLTITSSQFTFIDSFQA